VADLDAGDVGDGVVAAGGQSAEGDAQLAGTLAFGFTHEIS
jgi:hypothetical protein